MSTKKQTTVRDQVWLYLTKVAASLLWGVVGFWLTFLLFGITVGIMCIGSGQWIIQVAGTVSIANWIFLLWCAGYLSHAMAPAPKLAFSVFCFYSNVWIYVALLRRFLPQFVTRTGLNEDAFPDVDSLTNSDIVALLDEKFAIPFVAGVATSVLLHLLKRTRLTRVSWLQKALLRLTGLMAQGYAIAVVVVALVAVPVTILPDIAGFVLPTWFPDSYGAQHMHVGWLWFIPAVLLFVLVVFVKFATGLGYLGVASQILTSARCFHFACAPLPQEDPSVLVLRSFEDDQLYADAAEDQFEAFSASSAKLPPLVPLVFDFFLIAYAMVSHRPRPMLSSLASSNVGFVGNPRDSLPTWATSWYYFDDAEWQENVRRMMNHAKSIIVFVGMREGLAWEIQQIIRDDHLTKTLFLLPPSGGTDEDSMEVHKPVVTARLEAFLKASRDVGFELETQTILKESTFAFQLPRDGKVAQTWSQGAGSPADRYSDVSSEFVRKRLQR